MAPLAEVDWAALIGPAVIAAVVSGAIGLISLIVSTRTTRHLHRDRLDADSKIASQKADADIALAERKLALDRSLADWKRRTEFAEEVLADFYRARDIFTDARQPYSRAGEGRTRPGRTTDETDVERYRDTIYTPFERLLLEREFLSTISAKKFRFMALFGTKSGEAFQALTTAYNRISTATSMLISMPTHEHNATIAKLEALIGWNLDDDPIAPSLNQAIETIETACRPWLETTPI